MSRRPIVSAVLTTYARREGLRRALASVAAQQLAGTEAVVVNAGGPDVADVVAGFTDTLPVRLISLQAAAGLAVARKAGIAAARGEYLAFLDDDDLWLPDHLRTALAGMDGAGVDLVYTSCVVADRQYEPADGGPVPQRHRFDYPFDADLLSVANMIPVISVLARAFNPDGLDPGGAVQEDWAMWLGLVLGRGWRARHLPPVTTVYHRIPGAASMTGAAAATIAGVRRFAAGHRLLHQRWPVPADSLAGRARRLPRRMYALVEERHAAGFGVSHYYYERSLPFMAAAVAGRLSVAAAAAALAEAVAPDAAGDEERAA
jgi:glycosyltransferase involved in cell wall biosynthesis